MNWPHGVLSKKRIFDAPDSKASSGLLESFAMFDREVVEDILGDDGISDYGG